MLVDAPCSGFGTLRRNPDLKWRQTAETVAALAPTQRAILAAAARLVKPGGRLVYATCSVLEAENEAVAARVRRRARRRLRAPGRRSTLLQRAHVAGAETLVSGDDLRLWTHRHGTDGFFAAIWERH